MEKPEDLFMPQVLLSQYSVVVFPMGLDGPPRFCNNIFCCKGVESYTIYRISISARPF